ncbi:hypothetical protein ACUN7V_14650 [Quadrisphaera oryzae]|uniref:GlsB/YeaQ/YmgE family stress response membrane protein n=1 Tax=Quadrisphaera TaxID=317661 RepID=UPI001644E61D|nr:GlsB/YeaQ/YmgE family stress response membrane protein [Quadrisphaera sp. RL12-1S]MBC3763163.1 GlsB/YeaQ/YmgE family stress response membrane protein [Quadrisphaera sp. RL12-1S]
MQRVAVGIATLVVLGAVAGVLGLLLSPRRRRPAPSTAVLTGVALAFAGGFAGYLLGPKGGGGAFLTGTAWAGAAAGAALAVALLLLPLRRGGARDGRG